MWKQQEIKVYSSDSLLIKRQGSHLRISLPRDLLFLPDVFKGKSCAQYLRGVFVFWNKEDFTERHIVVEH